MYIYKVSLYIIDTHIYTSVYIYECVCLYILYVYRKYIAEEFPCPYIWLSPKPLLLLLPFSRYKGREIRLFNNTFTLLAWEK